MISFRCPKLCVQDEHLTVKDSTTFPEHNAEIFLNKWLSTDMNIRESNYIRGFVMNNYSANARMKPARLRPHFNTWFITSKCHHVGCLPPTQSAGIILCMDSANEKRRYNVTPSLIGWAQTIRRMIWVRPRIGEPRIPATWKVRFASHLHPNKKGVHL